MININIQIARLNIIFTKPKIVCPFRNNSRVSRLKVENVLNPPQKPVSKNKRIGESIARSAKYQITIPIMRQAVALARSVANGKLPVGISRTASEIP